MDACAFLCEGSSRMVFIPLEELLRVGGSIVKDHLYIVMIFCHGSSMIRGMAMSVSRLVDGSHSSRHNWPN